MCNFYTFTGEHAHYDPTTLTHYQPSRTSVCLRRAHGCQSYPYPIYTPRELPCWTYRWACSLRPHYTHPLSTQSDICVLEKGPWMSELSLSHLYSQRTSLLNGGAAPLVFDEDVPLSLEPAGSTVDEASATEDVSANISTGSATEKGRDKHYTRCIEITNLKIPSMHAFSPPYSLAHLSPSLPFQS